MTWRDAMCGDPRPDHVGESLTLAGWADTRRDHGGLVFVDLRDHTGVTQLVINPERSPTAAEIAKEIRNEFVLRARGVASDTDYAGRSLKGQLTQAGRSGATRVVVVGANGATIRVAGSDDEAVSHDALLDRLSK